MPNIGGPRSSKRSALAGAVHNMLLYGAPVWIGVLEYKKYAVRLGRVQRYILLRVASAYRTASEMALQVVTGTIPVDLLAHERKYMHKYEGNVNSARMEARRMSLDAWQKRWDEETTKAQWTKRLIRNIREWLDCRHRELNYYLTQFLTGHGCYRQYAKRFGKDEADECIYCAKTDTAEHTVR